MGSAATKKRLVICIGAQKAGTTWLADYMRAHPDVHCPPVKEVHYFDSRFLPAWCAKYEQDMLADFQRDAARLTVESAADPHVQQKLAALLLRFKMIADPADYMRFMQWGAGARPVLFEATPDYAMLGENGFRAMRAAHDDVRLIFLMRNPADRFWSALRFNKTHNPDFDIDVMFDRLILREDFALMADYGRTIEAARSVVGDDRLHFDFYERLFTREAVARICDFAEIRFFEPDFGRRSNESIKADMPPARRKAAVRAYSKTYYDINELTGGDIPDTWRADLAGLAAG